MATFSPSPAPRRSSRLQTRGTSPTKVQRPHRLATSPTQILNDNNSVASVMDIDDRSSIVTDRSLSRIGGDMIFSKTDEMSVSFYANLPLEVKQVLKISDFSRDLYSGEIDTLTGFALVTSSQTCFVWQHAQALRGIPTCYIFSSPDGFASSRPPLHALVPQGTSREPGLILVSITGQIRFWDSIGIGLAGGDNFVESYIDGMVENEDVTNLIRADAQTYILSTSFGRFFRLSLTTVGGKHHLISRCFTRPGSSRTLSRLIPFLSSASYSYETKGKAGHIHAIALGSSSSSGDKQLWALANGRLQHWKMVSEGWEDIDVDLDLTHLLMPKIQEKFSPYNEDLEFSDLAVFDDQHLAILISYSGKDTTDDFRRLYALAELQQKGNDFVVEHLRSVPYQTTSKPGPPVHPRIKLIYSGSIISVQFGDAVALCARGSEFRDRLELKGINDRTLGVGVSLSTDLLLILTANSMMKVSLDLSKIQGFQPDTGHTNLVKSIMMQAIIYGSSPLNPLRFSFPPEVNADALMNAAQQLSEAVLKSDPEVVRQSPDMTIQMTGRKERLSWLIGFINENAVLEKMTQECRQRLATDSEKLYACHQLWLNFNQSISGPKSVLKDAIVAYMEENRDASHEDVVRTFFRRRISDIGGVIQKVKEIVLYASKSTSSSINLHRVLSEAIRIVVILLRSSFEYRDYNLQVYGVDLPMIKPWSSRSAIVDTLRTLFDLTAETLKINYGFSDDDKAIDSQFPALAAVLLQSFKERVEWLSQTDKIVASQLEKEFSELRPKIFETLRRFKHENDAFSLAEKYQDYASLVSLCHQDTVYPPQSNPHGSRIRTYIQLYNESFTSELFRWYIQNGEIRTMFSENAPAGSEHLNRYFENKANRNIAISWINDLANSNYSLAAFDLFKDAKDAVNLEGRHLMLSIGKLSYLANIQETNAADVPVQVNGPNLDAFHYALDFVSVLENLIEEFRSVLLSVRTRQSVDGQIETIMKSKGRKLEDRKGFNYILRDLLRTLLKGEALSVEDTVDVLTLKDNSESVEDLATSLHLLATSSESSESVSRQAAEIPVLRKQSAFRTIWRRVYLHDNWDVLNQTSDVSDDELNARYRATALFKTIYDALLRDEERFILSPRAALLLPSPQEISSRWPGMTSETVSHIISDYEWESRRIENWELDDIYERIKQLAEEDVEIQNEVDNI